MSDKHPECPLYNPLNCKEFHNPKLCAFVRKDHACLKKKKPRTSPPPKAGQSPPPDPAPLPSGTLSGAAS
jgi:hypothetical protein